MEGYYKPSTEVIKNAMNPSSTLNTILNSIQQS